jgi:2-polyprenyl-3-methyl-5-hydroxy-6-metoxy-1,4-benzoquinol methylase
MIFAQEFSSGEDYKLTLDASGAHRKIFELVGRARCVLDVGCGSGYIGEYFKKQGAYVAGIEADPRRAAQAKGVLDSVIESDLDSLSALPFPEKYFEAVICADVLEHLKRPDLLLVFLARYLKDEGRLIVSVPNIARIDVRIKLLSGRFSYTDGGIMDKTHLRFFTKDSIRALLKESGYVIARSTYSGGFSKWPVLGIIKGMLAFQFIIEARKG